MSAAYQQLGAALRVVRREDEVDGLRVDQLSQKPDVHALTGEPELREAERLRRLQLVTDAALAHLCLDDLHGNRTTGRV
jgi:hypothetical protein